MADHLNDAQILHLWDTHVGNHTDKLPLTDDDKIGFARAVLYLACPAVAVQEEGDDFADTAMGLVDVYAESIRAFDPTEHQIRERANIDHYLRRCTAPKTPLDRFIDDVEAYLGAQDALDNREYMGINAEPYDVLMRRRNVARDDLDKAKAAAMRGVNHG